MVTMKNVSTIVRNLKSAGITEIVKGIPVDDTNVFTYLTIAEETYYKIDEILARTAPNQAFPIIKSIATANHKKLNKLLGKRLFLEYVNLIYNILTGANFDINMSREMLASHIKAAEEDFPNTDIAATLILLESPIVLKQAIDSITNYDNERLKQYLDYATDTYLSV